MRIAEPGEFTRRALENEQLGPGSGRRFGDLVEAETEAQRRQALAGVLGRFGGKGVCLARAVDPSGSVVGGND